MSSKYSHTDIPICLPDLLLPSEGVDMHLWATVACDQYTSEPDYWQRVEAAVSGKPSTYNLMLPELYLDEPDVDSRIATINKNMDAYRTNGVLRTMKQSFMTVRRTTPFAPTRTGLIAAFDLLAYDFKRGSQSLIRATEGTVTERIPPRMKIRRNASLEMPHILILIDDPMHTVIEPVSRAVDASGAAPVYDFDLMENGGHIIGHTVSDERLVTSVFDALAALTDEETFAAKYGIKDSGVPPLLFAVGDGNHSLASAKCCYDEDPTPLKRFALAEIVNVHDIGIRFEPIHRVLFGADIDELTAAFERYFTVSARSDADADCHVIPWITAERRGSFNISRSVHTLAVGALQMFLDDYLASHSDARLDYIHGKETVEALASSRGNVGFILPPMDKNDLFTTVIRNGALPRKTFSMGEACEKRFYLECRSIR